MDNEVSEVSQVENSTNAKTSWVHTSTANQIGTILWAISTVLFFFIFINFAGMWSAAASLAGGSSVGSVGMKISAIFTLPIFVLYLALSVGMFLGFNACTAIAKSYGIVTLIFDIIMIIATIIFISIVGPMIAGALGSAVNFTEIFGGFFDKAKDLASSIDKDTLKDFAQASKDAAKEVAKIAKENPDLVNKIVNEAGKELSDAEMLNALANAGSQAAAEASDTLRSVASDPEAVAMAQAGAKFLKCFLFIIFVLPITQILTIICGFILKISGAKKTRVVSLVLCIFMGMVGGHLLYVGRTGKAVLRIIFTITFVLGFVSAILCIIDFIKILAGAFYDKDKKPVVAWV